MTTAAEWEAAKSKGHAYYPKTFEADGDYTHATGVPSRLIETANHFYQVLMSLIINKIDTSSNFYYIFLDSISDLLYVIDINSSPACSFHNKQAIFRRTNPFTIS